MSASSYKNLLSFHRVKNWYARFERPISSLSLIGGFVFDAITLTRVDMLKENLWVGVHLFFAGLFIVLINREENIGTEAKDPEKLHFWLLNGMQFMFGGLLSTFLVFYFRSGSLWTSWPFLLFLAIAFTANERLKPHFERLTFQISFFFLSLFSFSIFLVPILMHSIGSSVFLISGAASLVFIFIFIAILNYAGKEKYDGNKWGLYAVVLTIFLAVNILYFFNLIPPIPLSLKNSGIYHDISKDEQGNYDGTYEYAGLLGYFDLYEDVHVTPGEAIYAYSSIFSPANLNTDIVHEWQYKDPQSGEWVTASVVHLPISGGREEGYRTYSLKRSLADGKWRVNIETKKGELLGRIHFNVITRAVATTSLLRVESAPNNLDLRTEKLR
jgi:hypothetical protein